MLCPRLNISPVFGSVINTSSVEPPLGINTVGKSSAGFAATFLYTSARLCFSALAKYSSRFTVACGIAVTFEGTTPSLEGGVPGVGGAGVLGAVVPEVRPVAA